MLFTSYVWGTRHAGMNGQRVTSAISAIHRSLGYSDTDGPNGFPLLNSDICHASLSSDSSNSSPFNTLNYSDDTAGVEATLERATLSFNVMGSLLEDLGFAESKDKAVPPTQCLTYLGIQFNTSTLEMSIDETKCAEIRTELNRWIRKTVNLGKTSLGF